MAAQMTVRVLIGDALEQLKGLPDESVHCCVTSPPYYGLRCYGTEGQIGLEATPEAHIAKLVEVFREVRRVLRKDGVLWLNYGDAYTSTAQGTFNAPERIAGIGGRHGERGKARAQYRPFTGLKPKDLLMMPSRVALALQADGWWLRSMMPWIKRSAMPESVTDRPATAIEYIFLLTKNPRYFFDMEAVRQEWADDRCGKPGSPSPKSGIIPGQTPHSMASKAWESNGKSGRNFRNSDLFYASLQPPHGLIYADDPLALDVNPAGFSDWTPTVRRVSVPHDDPSDDKRCIPSPDCPKHADLIALVTSELCDEHGDGRSPDSDSIGARLVARLANGSVPIDLRHAGSTSQQSSDCSDQPCFSSATDRSKESRKTGRDPETNRPCTPSAENLGRIADRSASPELIGPSHSTAGSNTAEGECGDNPNNRKSDRTAGKRQERASCEASVSPECTCQWYIEKTEKTSHFATFPPKLIEPLIKAATSEKGCCAECGAPWVREVERQGVADIIPSGNLNSGRHPFPAAEGAIASKTLGWSPSCACDAPNVHQCTILDPFAGAGTTGLVADRLGRNAILIELNPEYASMAQNRIRQDAGMFAELTE